MRSLVRAMLAALAVGSLSCSGTNAGDEGSILSAFFGLDDALPTAVGVICGGQGAGMDGMPVVFSRRVVQSTLAASDFAVETLSGRRLVPVCATLAPALGSSERHTVLLVGDLGDATSDPPVRVRVTGELGLEGDVDASGSSAPVTPLSDGPSLVLALRYDPAALPGSACPPTTQQIVQVTFAGGVRAVGGADLGAAELARFRVRVESPSGDAEEIAPDAFADLGDMDNYVHLCLGEGARSPVSVRLEADTVIDPNGDPNPDTEVRVEEGGKG